MACFQIFNWSSAGKLGKSVNLVSLISAFSSFSSDVADEETVVGFCAMFRREKDSAYGQSS